MDFAEYFRKPDVSENSKVYYGQFLRNGFHERKGIVILVKIAEMYKYIEVCQPLFIGR